MTDEAAPELTPEQRQRFEDWQREWDAETEALLRESPWFQAYESIAQSGHPTGWLVQEILEHPTRRAHELLRCLDPIWPSIEDPQLDGLILRDIGTPEQIAEALEAIRVALEKLNPRSARATELRQLAERLAADYEKAVEVERCLADVGRRFNPKTGEVEHFRPRHPGPNPGLLVYHVGWAWKELKAQHPEKLQQGNNSQQVREWIAERLRHGPPPPEDLDPEPRGPIDRALRNYLKRYAESNRR